MSAYTTAFSSRWPQRCCSIKKLFTCDIALINRRKGGPLWKKLVPSIKQKRDAVPWLDGCVQLGCRYISLFEAAKVTTVDIPMWAIWSLAKFGIKSMSDINREPQTLSVNIFEAMLQDTAQGSNDNADAGFELARTEAPLLV